MMASSPIPQAALALSRRPDNLLKQVSEAVCEAGQKIMHFYQGDTDVTFEDNSPLTASGRASHCFLLQGLLDITPEIDVVSEESVEDDCCSFVGCKSWCLLDPFDGAKEFINGTNEFTVNAALIENGRPALGVVHAPALDLTYYAVRGSGAWRQAGIVEGAGGGVCLLNGEALRQT
jgi:3'(2'), 5'-bisphosphate nucleotidase